MSEVLTFDELCYGSYGIGSLITDEDTPVITTTFVGYWILMLLDDFEGNKND